MKGHFYFAEEKQRRLEQHREFYTRVNTFSSDIINADPNISPLEVLKTSIQLHQQSEAKEQEKTSKNRLLMMPSLSKIFL